MKDKPDVIEGEVLLSLSLCSNDGLLVAQIRQLILGPKAQPNLFPIPSQTSSVPRIFIPSYAGGSHPNDKRQGIMQISHRHGLERESNNDQRSIQQLYQGWLPTEDLLPNWCLRTVHLELALRYLQGRW